MKILYFNFLCYIKLDLPVVVKEEDEIGEHVQAVGEGPDGEREQQDPDKCCEPIDVVPRSVADVLEEVLAELCRDRRSQGGPEALLDGEGVLAVGDGLQLDQYPVLHR